MALQRPRADASRAPRLAAAHRRPIPTADARVAPARRGFRDIAARDLHDLYVRGQEGSYSALQIEHLGASAAGVPSHEVAAWAADLRALARAGDYFFSLNPLPVRGAEATPAGATASWSSVMQRKHRANYRGGGESWSSMPRAWVYLPRCRDGSLYTGWTVDLECRLARHHAGIASRYGGTGLPIEL